MGHQRRISLLKLIARVLAPNFHSGPFRPPGGILRKYTLDKKGGSASEQGGTSNFASRLIGLENLLVEDRPISALLFDAQTKRLARHVSTVDAGRASAVCADQRKAFRMPCDASISRILLFTTSGLCTSQDT
jgi:hypothetical protein